MVLSESLTCGLIDTAGGIGNEPYGSLVVVKKIKKVRGRIMHGCPESCRAVQVLDIHISPHI
jgi:hypothetical protein